MISEASPLLAELTGLFFISIAITGLIIYTDITFHDKYVLFLISECHAENQDQLCTKYREKEGLPSNAQMEIGNPYWNILAIQSILLPITFAGFRALTIVIRHRKITELRVFMIILWGLVPFLLFYFGSIDVFYYLGRTMEIPDQLNWLNNAGVFQYTKAFGTDPLNVERSDLLFTFGLGVILISVLFFIAVKMYERSGLKSFV